MAKFTENQQRSLDRLKKAIANHVAKPTEESKAVVLKQYDAALRNTLSAEHLTKDEVAALKVATDTPAE